MDAQHLSLKHSTSASNPSISSCMTEERMQPVSVEQSDMVPQSESGILAMQTIYLHGLRACRICRNHILTRPVAWFDRRDKPLVRWMRFAAFVLLTPLQRLGKRCWFRRKWNLRHLASAKRMLKFWSYLVQDCDSPTALPNWDRKWSCWMRCICDRGYHIWSPIVLRNYLRFSVCSKGCLCAAIEHARLILLGAPTRITAEMAEHFIRITAARYKLLLTDSPSAGLDVQGADEKAFRKTSQNKIPSRQLPVPWMHILHNTPQHSTPSPSTGSLGVSSRAASSDPTLTRSSS